MTVQNTSEKRDEKMSQSDYKEIHRCNRCGFCLNVCPTYMNSQFEAQSARGRIRLMRLLNDKKFDWSNDQGISEKVNDCLLCRACVVNCPATVGTDLIMLEARRDFLKIKGLSLFQKLVYRGTLSHRERLDRSSVLMRLYEKSGARNIMYGTVLRKALDRLIYFDSFLPADLEPPALKNLPELIKPEGEVKMKVAYFVGCASNIFAARTVRIIANYLAKCGVEVHLPKKVGCCGEPHRTTGDDKEVRRLAKQNSALIFKEEFDYIVSDCSTCAHALASYDKFLGEETEEAKRIKPLLSKVMDINTLVVDHLGLPKDGLKELPPTKVTYHDSCHAVRGLNIKSAPREILKAVPGITLVEMKGADSCCGGAGAYGFTHPEMSGRIASTKVKNIQDSGAELLSTSCPACTLQLGAGLRRAALDLKVLHPVEILAKASGLD